MKIKTLSFLLALALVISLFPLGLQVSAEGQTPAPPKFPIFQMEAVSKAQGELTAGDTLSVEFYGRPLNSEEEPMGAFHIKLAFPEDRLKLVSITIGDFVDSLGQPIFGENIETKTATFCVNAEVGVTLPKSGLLLLTAEFQVLPTMADTDVTVGMAYAEISRTQDLNGQPITSKDTGKIQIHHIPEVQLPEEGSVKDGQVEVTLHNNPAGTLFTAVYREGGQLLRCAVTPDIPAKSPRQTVELDLSEGAYVKTFLLDSETSIPLSAAAEMKLK